MVILCVPWEDRVAVTVNVACAPPLPLSCSVTVFSPALREDVGMEIGREPTVEMVGSDHTEQKTVLNTNSTAKQ